MIEIRNADTGQERRRGNNEENRKNKKGLKGKEKERTGKGKAERENRGGRKTHMEKQRDGGEKQRRETDTDREGDPAIHPDAFKAAGEEFMRRPGGRLTRRRPCGLSKSLVFF